MSRFHMPGHKGFALHGLEHLDLTEIKGADSLFEADGIISRGESLTSRAYGSRLTCWSAEGSSLSIKAALCMVSQLRGGNITVAAPRNCHRAFLSACALLGTDPVWLWSGDRKTLCECPVTAEQAAECLGSRDIDAVYITSPDYLGHIADIRRIAEVCHEHGALLICDNAHGAYLKFAGGDIHPLSLGADIVCDSAHKTLPVYTGGAYLHISRNAPEELDALAKPAMALFGSTSPSYLIMQSLDICAELLNGKLPEMIRGCCERTARIKALMRRLGIPDISDEPMKLTIGAEGIGYDGNELAEIMRGEMMECEYSDPAAVVLMLSPYNTEKDFCRLEGFLSGLEIRPPRRSSPAVTAGLGLLPERAASIREAVLSMPIRLSAEKAVGKVCARAAMSCQPSVAAVMPGERVTRELAELLKMYGINEIDVMTERLG